MHLSLIPKRSERNKINSKRNEKSVSVRVSGSGRDTAKGREGVRGVKKAGERRRSRKTNSMKENDSRERRRPPTKRTHVASYTYTHTFPSVSSTYSRSSPLSPSLPPSPPSHRSPLLPHDPSVCPSRPPPASVARAAAAAVASPCLPPTCSS